MRLPVLVLVPLVVALAAAPAVAAWLVPGTGTTSVAAAALAPPLGVAAGPVAPTSSAVDLTWSAPANPAGTAFQVVRDKTVTGAPGPVTLACSASPCHDTGLAAGTTYSYSVRAALGGWASPAVTATVTTTASGLVITSSTANRPGKVRFTGTGAVAGAAVDVALCLGALPTCAPSGLGYLETVTVTPASAGAWTTGPTGTRVLPGVAYTATASQGGVLSPPYAFTG